MKGAHGVGDAAALLDDVLIRAYRVDVPLPGVLERVDLSTPRTKTCPRGPRCELDWEPSFSAKRTL